VIQDRDPQNLTSLLQASGHHAVLVTRGGIAARVVVDQDESRRSLPESRAEDLARMDETGGEGPLGDHLLAQNAVSPIQQKHHEAFLGLVS